MFCVRKECTHIFPIERTIGTRPGFEPQVKVSPTRPTRLFNLIVVIKIQSKKTLLLEKSNCLFHKLQHIVSFDGLHGDYGRQEIRVFFIWQL